MNTGREIFLEYLQEHYNPPPPRSKAPEVGQQIAKATWAKIKDNDVLLQACWFELCGQWANRYLKDPPGLDDDLQTAFGFYKTPVNEQAIITEIGHRRMQTPDDDQAMIDLVNPDETSSDELFRLADRLQAFGKLCADRAFTRALEIWRGTVLVRRLARSRKNRGF